MKMMTTPDFESMAEFKLTAATKKIVYSELLSKVLLKIADELKADLKGEKSVQIDLFGNMQFTLMPSEQLNGIDADSLMAELKNAWKIDISFYYKRVGDKERSLVTTGIFNQIQKTSVSENEDYIRVCISNWAAYFILFWSNNLK